MKLCKSVTRVIVSWTISFSQKNANNWNELTDDHACTTAWCINKCESTALFMWKVLYGHLASTMHLNNLNKSINKQRNIMMHILYISIHACDNLMSSVVWVHEINEIMEYKCFLCLYASMFCVSCMHVLCNAEKKVNPQT